MINKKTNGLYYLKTLKTVDQTSLDQTLPDQPRILNATKTSYTKDRETLHDSPLSLNDIPIPDTQKRNRQLRLQVLFKNNSLR